MPKSKREGKVRDISIGKRGYNADKPGKPAADGGGRTDEAKSKGNITINVDDAQLDQTAENQTTENKTTGNQR